MRALLHFVGFFTAMTFGLLVLMQPYMVQPPPPYDAPRFIVLISLMLVSAMTHFGEFIFLIQKSMRRRPRKKG